MAVNAGLNPVNVPPELNVRLLTFIVVVGMANAVVPKLNALNQLLVVIVCTAVPDPVSVRLGALVLEPPEVPNEYVLVISAAAVKPPVPVQEKLVAAATAKQVVPAVVCANTILPVPNATLRAVVEDESNMPVVSVNPPISNAPAFWT